ncbi:Gfo/Idh/MocA family protein [Saccharospirillum sp.]|uniref:Gfo/Idh/MocA family protein n=1 Tax=Saccharospirillum sp. TaxID=2033801 RepID=UPI0034A09032
MIRTLVVGMGQMGQSHAIAYHEHADFEIAGLVNRSQVSLEQPLDGYAVETDFKAALQRLQPDLVSIATYSDSHAELAIAAMKSGANVFVEKPIAATTADAHRVAEIAAETGCKLVVGHILRHHPTWQAFIGRSRAFGGPYVFRMNLNQRSKGSAWEVHKRLMDKTSPIVDCGVHYVDVMCQITDAKPVEVRAIGLRLTDEIALDMYNYGQFQVLFSDGSCGWYEAGWGPMMSETAHFVKDVVTPNGSISLREPLRRASSDLEGHTAADVLVVAATGENEALYDFDSPDHQGLCNLQAEFVSHAIINNLDLTRHISDVVRSLEICLAADESVRTGKPIKL